MAQNVVRICVCLLTLMAPTSSRVSPFLAELSKTASARGYPLLETPTPVTSDVHCAVKCASLIFCSMFRHSPSLQQCALYGVTNQTTSTFNMSGESDWKSYVYNSDCPHLYVRALDACWKIILTYTTMPQATTTCNDLGGTLLQPESIDEFEFLRRAILSTLTWSINRYYLGALKSTANFTWITSGKVVDSRMWQPGQPDAFGGPTEFCVETTPFFNYYLNDLDCNIAQFAICNVP